jgi:hypothetical protein
METAPRSGLMEELQSQLESAVAFADLCSYLTENRLGAQAAELVRLAEQLYGAAVESAASNASRA